MSNFLKISPDSRSTAAGQSQINGRTRVKILRKVAVEFSWEVEIIGGGGQIVSGGGGLKYFGEQMELFPWCRVFLWELQFFLWGFFLWWALFFDKDISLKDLNLSFSNDKILPEIDSPKRTTNCILK